MWCEDYKTSLCLLPRGVVQPPKAATLKKAKFKFEERTFHDKKNLPTTHWVSNIAFSCDKHSPYPRGSWPNRDRTLSLWIVGNTSTLHRVLSLHVTTGRCPVVVQTELASDPWSACLKTGSRRISSPERLFPSVLLKALDTHREPDHLNRDGLLIMPRSFDSHGIIKTWPSQKVAPLLSRPT
mgnify:CR=1 FL=1